MHAADHWSDAAPQGTGDVKQCEDLSCGDSFGSKDSF